MPALLRLALVACVALQLAPAAAQPDLMCAPTGVQADPVGVVIRLSWTPTPGALEYHVYKAKAGSEEAAGRVATVAAPANESFDTQVEGGVTYLYSVRASFGGVEAEPCGVVEARASFEPCRPAPSALALDGPAVQVRWSGVALADGYNVYRAEGDGPMAMLASVDAGTQALLDADVEAGITYRYAVAAVVDGDERAPCPAVEVTAIPSFPAAFGVLAAAGLGTAAYAAMRRRR